jgi:hypothetical protein
MHCKALSVNFVLRPDLHQCRCIWHWNVQTFCLQVTTPSHRRALTISDVDAPFSRSTLMRCLLYIDKHGQGGIVTDIIRGRRRPPLSENDTRCHHDRWVKTHCCLPTGGCVGRSARVREYSAELEFKNAEPQSTELQCNSYWSAKLKWNSNWSVELDLELQCGARIWCNFCLESKRPWRPRAGVEVGNGFPIPGADNSMDTLHFFLSIPYIPPGDRLETFNPGCVQLKGYILRGWLWCLSPQTPRTRRYCGWSWC